VYAVRIHPLFVPRCRWRLTNVVHDARTYRSSPRLICRRSPPRRPHARRTRRPVTPPDLIRHHAMRCVRNNVIPAAAAATQRHVTRHVPHADTTTVPVCKGGAQCAVVMRVTRAITMGKPRVAMLALTLMSPMVITRAEDVYVAFYVTLQPRRALLREKALRDTQRPVYTRGATRAARRRRTALSRENERVTATQARERQDAASARRTRRSRARMRRREDGAAAPGGEE